MSPPSSPPSSAYSPPISYSPPPRLSPWRGVSVDTILAQAGGDALGLPHAASTLLGDATGSLVPPIFPSTTYARDAETYAPRVLDVRGGGGGDDDLAEKDGEWRPPTRHHPPSQLVYSRPDNPTYARCERVLAALDRGVDAMLFASGMAAVSAVAPVSAVPAAKTTNTTIPLPKPRPTATNGGGSDGGGGGGGGARSKRRGRGRA